MTDMNGRSQDLSTSAKRVQEALDKKGVHLEVVEIPASTRTAGEAAEAVGCLVSQIAKSLVFRRNRSAQPLLVIASGSNRVDEQVIKAHVGEPVSIADADFVRAMTGFAIGGVPPIGHLNAIETFIDRALFDHEQIWAAAGTPHAVFRLEPKVLKSITNGRVIRITP